METNWTAKYEAQQKANAVKAKADLLALIPALKAAGAVKLVIHYDGSGDSGEVESVRAFRASGEEFEVSDMVETADRAACDILSGQGIDWYNNDGGFGDVILDVEAGTIKIEDNARFSDSTYSECEV